MTYKQRSNTNLRPKAQYKGTVLAVFFLAFIVLVSLFGFRSNAAECLTFRSETYHNYYETELISLTRDHVALEGCNLHVLMTGAEYAELKLKSEIYEDVEPITTVSIMAAFTFGLSVYLLCWFLGYKGRMARIAISRL